MQAWRLENRAEHLKWRRKREGGPTSVSREERAVLRARAKEEKSARRAESIRLGEQRRQEQRRASQASKPWRTDGLTEAERFKIRYRMDPAFNLRQRVRTAMRHKARGVRIASLMREALYRDGRSPTIENMLGYTIGTLGRHLREQFTDGMTWERFLQGDIHIDHKRPLASFDLSVPEQVVEAWALSNLQPLWAAENRAKAARWAA